MLSSLRRFLTPAILLVSLGGAAVALAQPTPLTTAFTYQGELASAGTPATGTYDIRFRLYDAASGGTQIGGALCSDNLAVSAGRFGASLDFGGVFTGQKRFLEIEVRQDAGLDCSDASGYTVLSPRQELTATPNATFALTASNASSAASLNGQPASYFTNAANLTGTVPNASLSPQIARLNTDQTFTGRMTFSNPASAFTGAFSGSGAGLTNLSGGNITAGTLARSSLNADVQSGVGTLVPELSLTGSIATGSTPYSVAVSGSFAYVVNGGSSTLQVFNISNPAAPTLAGSVTTGNGPSSVAVSGSFAYVLNIDLDTLQVIDISNPAAPTLAGSVATGSGPYSVAVSGSFAYVVNASSNTLQVFNISNPAAPTPVGSVATGFLPFSVAVSGSFAYVVNYISSTLQIFNISNPAAPTLAGSVATGNQPWSVAMAGSFAYVVNGSSSTLQVFNIGNPAAPTLAGSVATGSNPNSVAVSGSLAYVVNYNSASLQVFNISSPNAPTLAGSIATGGRPNSVAVSGSYAYVVNVESDRLQLFNAANRVGFNTPLAASSLAGVNGSGLTGVNAATLNGQAASFYTSASNITTGTLANGRTTGSDLDEANTLVLRDASGNFAAGTITAALSGNATTATTAATASNAGLLNGQPASFYTDASNITTGTLGAAQIPNLDAAKIATGTLSNTRTSGTNLNSPSTLVLRDASGNFSAGTISAALNGNAASATTAANATTATTATNATLLNGQPASFYTNASNMNTGTLADSLLSSNIPRLNVNNTFAGDTTFANKIRVNNGVITDGANSVVTADLGLYTQRPGFLIRFVTSGGGFVWYTDGATTPAGGTPRMTLTSAGNLSVVGSLSKGGGSFKIDHPLDPDNKYLYHSFVESPDMMNIYNGITTTDARGYAIVELPDYFEALNRDFRYQLTVLDDSENDFILAKVYRKIGVDAPRQFTIKSSMPNIEVSWQVTGIRQDAWAQKNRIPNSVDKPASEKGKLLHPEAFGKAAEQGIVTAPGAGAAAAK